MKKLFVFGAVILCAATVCARPHHHHGNKGLHLAAGIVNLVGASINTVAAVFTPRTVVVTPPPPPPRTVIVTPPPPPPRPVVVTPPPPPRPVVIHHPAPRPVHRPAPPVRHHAPGYRGGRR